MTKEELRKEATSTVAWECTQIINRPLFVQAYTMGAEPREKRIEELKKENFVMERIIIGNQEEIAELEKENNHLLLEGAKRVEELEKENAKLKESVEKMKCCGNCIGSCNTDDMARFCKDNNYKLWEIKENEV